ncbi:MAG: GNAT family N-acetyltransferase [Phycisphaerae bacterium]
MRVAIRSFTEDDIAFALVQTSREGWDATSELFELLLAHDPHACFIAEHEGQRVGMVTTTTYRNTAWIGNLIVPPQYRGCGVGSRIMTHAMKHLSQQGIRTIRLEADPPGIKLYRRLGFVEEFESLRFRHERPTSISKRSADRLVETDLPEVAVFDARYFGDDRRRLLGMFFEYARTAYQVRAGGALRAYAMALPCAFGVRIGPWVAQDRDAAHAVLQSVLTDVQGKTVCLGVLSVNREAVELLASLGFERTPSSFRMVHGEACGCGEPERIFAIGGGAMG